MYSTVFSLAGFLLAVFLSFVHLTSATPSPSQPSPRVLDFRYPVIRKRVPATLPAGWTHLGCYMDSSSRPPLTSFSKTNPDNAMTVEYCVNFCIDENQNYAGLEDGTICHCGNVLTVGSTETPPADCSNGSNCPGNPDEKCGATDRLDIYRSGAPAQPLPTIAQTVDSWTFAGCVKDSNDHRTLPVPGGVDQLDLTVGVCIEACKNLGNNTAGMEFARECWCGSGGIPDRGKIIDQNNCILACPMNSTQICGGANSLVVYAAPGV